MEVKKSGDIFKMFVCKKDQRNRVVAREEHVLKGSLLLMMGLTRTCMLRK